MAVYDPRVQFEIDKGKKKGGFDIYVRRCKRCEELFNTPYRYGKVCAGCKIYRYDKK